MLNRDYAIGGLTKIYNLFYMFCFVLTLTGCFGELEKSTSSISENSTVEGNNQQAEEVAPLATEIEAEELSPEEETIKPKVIGTAGVYKIIGSDVFVGDRLISNINRGFEVLEDPAYAKDVFNIFYFGQSLVNMSPEKTNILGDGYSRSDKAVYYLGRVLTRGEDLNPVSPQFFTALGGDYAKDNEGYFYKNRELDEVIGELRPLGEGYSTDAVRVYFQYSPLSLYDSSKITPKVVAGFLVLGDRVFARTRGVKLNGEIDEFFKPLGDGYAIINDSVFYNMWGKIAEADQDSFQVLDHGYAKDDTHLYFQGRSIPSSAPTSLIFLGGGFAKTNDLVLYDGRVIDGAQAASFTLIATPAVGEAIGKDDVSVYRGLRVIAQPEGFRATIFDDLYIDTTGVISRGRRIIGRPFSALARSTFQVNYDALEFIGDGIAKDDRFVFRWYLPSGSISRVWSDKLGELAPNRLDLPTLEYVGGEFVKDINGVQPLTTSSSQPFEPDIASFKVYGGLYAADSEFVYFGKRVLSTEVESFQVLDPIGRIALVGSDIFDYGKLKFNLADDEKIEEVVQLSNRQVHFLTNNRVFLYGSERKDIDLESFKFISTGQGNFSRDRDRLFYLGYTLEGLDPNNTIVLTSSRFRLPSGEVTSYSQYIETLTNDR